MTDVGCNANKNHRVCCCCEPMFEVAVESGGHAQRDCNAKNKAGTLKLYLHLSQLVVSAHVHRAACRVDDRGQFLLTLCNAYKLQCCSVITDITPSFVIRDYVFWSRGGCGLTHDLWPKEVSLRFFEFIRGIIFEVYNEIYGERKHRQEPCTRLKRNSRVFQKFLSWVYACAGLAPCSGTYISRNDKLYL